MAAPHPGKWEIVLNQSQCLLNTGETAVHACLLGNHSTQVWKILYFFAGQGSGPYKSGIWNPANNAITEQTIPNWSGSQDPPPWPPRLFCSGHALMPDGKLLVAGGEIYSPEPPPLGLPYTYIFNQISESWSIPGTPGPPHTMAAGRYYPTITTLGAGQGGQGYGKILAMSGLTEDGRVNEDPEIYNPLTGWSKMTNPQLAVQPFEDVYPGSHIIPYGPQKGKVFYTIPMFQAYAFNPFADGQEEPFWTAIGSQRSTDRHGGNSILLPLLPGSTNAKVLITCGGYTVNNTVEIINLADQSPDWGGVPNMFIARHNANAIILPDDRVLIIGGNKIDRHEDPVYPTEAFDPATGEWTLLPAMNIFRSYHSVAILLPVGRIWLSGTTFPGCLTDWQHNIDIYSPGYLFEGDRPAITSCPDTISYGSQFSIITDLPIANIRLIRFGSMTHSTDTDQRSVGLSFTEVINSGYSLDVTAPADADLAPPGLYMLFVLRPKEASLSGQTTIPSVAKIVRLTAPF